MRNTIATLLVLGSLTACGGGGSDGNRAPVVTLTAKATAESGEIVPLTVSVSDDKDMNLDYTLSCTGGSLTGTLLTVPDVTANTTIDCTASATDSGGKNASAKVTITVQPATSSLTLATGFQTASAGGIGVVLVDNVEMTQDSYQGTLGGKPVTLVRLAADELAYILPIDAPTGAGEISVTIGSKAFKLPITVNAAPTVVDPRAKVTTLFSDVRQYVSNTIANGSLNANDKALAEGNLAKLDETIASLSSISDADVLKFATILAANGLISTGAQAARATYGPINVGDNCAPAIGDLSWNALGLTVALVAMAGGADLMFTATLPTLLAGGGAVALGWAVLLKVRPKFNAARRQFWDQCITEFSLNLVPIPDTVLTGNVVRPMAVASGVQSFQPKKSRAFQLSRSFGVLEGFAAEAAAIYGKLQSVVTSSLIPDDLKAEIGEVEISGVQTVPTSRISLTGVTGGVTGGIGATSDTDFRLTFNAEPPQTGDTIEFNFTLNRVGEEALSVPAKLIFDLPEADDIAIEVIQGRSTSSQVQSRGADTHEVVASPAHGSVTLNADGTFTYTPSGTYFGTDQFTYRARNEDGVSNTATVMIAVVRKFDGAWQVQSTSTTTSQSSPGLCPDESNNFTSTVTKLSDTQYQTVYSGITIPFSMGSKDDPNGLVGSKTVTYDDDPGETTESITIRIPDSNHLSGSGSWSYSGPNGTFCSGTTSVTGTR